jgi:hypothetical protein
MLAPQRFHPQTNPPHHRDLITPLYLKVVLFSIYYEIAEPLIFDLCKLVGDRLFKMPRSKIMGYKPRRASDSGGRIGTIWSNKLVPRRFYL